MDKFARALVGTRAIPFAAGAAFFTKMKTASWTDPPDQEGVMEGRFAVSAVELLDKLKQVITAKARLMLAYYTYAQSLKGEGWRATKTEFYEHAEDEREGFEYYLKRAAALGGPVHYEDVEVPPPASEPITIFNILARAEQEGILVQRELREMVGEDNPMRVGIEEHMLKDQHHLDEMWQMMPQGASQGSLVPTIPQEIPEEVPEGAAEESTGLPEEKVALLRQKFAFCLTADKLREKRGSEDAAAREKGRERAIANLSAEAHREKGRRGERLGATAGGALGAAGGYLLGNKYLKHPMGPSIGAGIGYLVGNKAGKELGTEVDIRKNASVKVAFGSDPAAYLEQESQAREIQGQNEAAFYRQKMREATQAMQDAQAQLSQTQQQADQLGGEVQERTQQALEANMSSTEQAREIANLRIGTEKMRQAMLQLAAQDPVQLASPMPDAALGDPNMEGAAGEAPDAQGGASAPTEGVGGPNTPGGAVAGSGPGSARPVAAAGGELATKQGSAAAAVKARAPWAAGGALLGAGGALLAGKKAPGLREHAGRLAEKREPGDEKTTKELARTYRALRPAERAETNPRRAAILGGLAGGVTMATSGPELMAAVKRLKQGVDALRR